MYKLSFSLLFLLLLSLTTLAQRGSIKGIVVDSLTKSPIEHATIAVVNSKDTSLVAYTLSQKDGTFKLTSLPVAISNRLVISIMRYHNHKQTLKLKPNLVTDLGQVSLSAQSLNEVTIKAERPPITVRKDTVDFSAEAFKTRPNAVVEDLLRLLPGVQVNYDGTILFNGKKVNRLLIDGKRFFGNDPKVATKNLDADMLDKVQVYDDREDDPDHKLSEQEVGKVINLKMKNKIKKSTLGKVYAGIGTNGRRQVGGILSNFRDTLQVSVIGLSNNLNQTGFSTDELYTMGGFNRSQTGQYYDGTFGGQNWGGGIQSVTSAGTNINNDYGAKLRLNLNYFYTGTNTVNSSKDYSQQTTDQTVLTSQSQGSFNNINRKHAVSGTFEWKPDTSMRIVYQPSVTFQSNPNHNSYIGSYANLAGPISNSFSADSNNNNSANFSHNLMFYHKLGHKGKSITINQSLTVNNDKANGYGFANIQSYVPSIPTQVIDRHNDNNNINNTFGLSVSYYHPFTKKFNAELNTNTRYLVTTGREFIYDRNPYTGVYSLYNDTLSKNLTRHWFLQNIKPVFNYKFKDDISLKLGLDLEIQNVTNYFNIDTVSNINKKYYLLFPSVELNVKGVTVNYGQSYDLPSIDDMVPITRIYSATYRVTGNPDLKPNRVHTFALNYYHYNNDKQFNTNFYGGLNLANDARIDKTTIDAVGARTVNHLNLGNSVRSYFGGNIGKQFKARQKWQVGLSNNFNGGVYQSAFFLNADQGLQYNYRFSTTQNVNFNYNSIISFNTNYRFEISQTKYKDVNYPTVNTWSHTVGSDISLRWPTHFIFDAKYNYNYRPQVGQGFQRSSHIVDLAATWLTFNKERGQFKLSVYDVFNQNITVYRYAYQNSVNISQQEMLKRYFMLTFQYRLIANKSK